jgi:Mg-chelatase subunit ChlD
MGHLGALSGSRRWSALVLRSFVLIAVVLTLAEIKFVRTSDQLTVIYVLDQSASVPREQRLQMIRYVNAEIEEHRNAAQGDKVGVIVFGRGALIEQPPHDATIRLPVSLAGQLETDATNLADALKLAQSSLPENSSGRIVIVCDGNENVGDARQQAQRLTSAGIGIDVVPILYAQHPEVAIEKITVPLDANRGQPFEIRTVINSLGTKSNVGGTLKIIRKTNEREDVLQEQHLELTPGKHVYSLREVLDSTDFYTYEARFVPDDTKHDAYTQNNSATSFTNVRGKGQVLVIDYHDPDTNTPRGQHDFLIQALKSENLQVTVRSNNDLFTSLAELQAYDTVVLCNTPREMFTEEQVRMLIHNTRELGAGLVLLGGENAFGAGGWADSELEAALPVDFQIRNAQVAPVGALAMVIDRSGSMSGDKLSMAVASAIASVEVLAPWDTVVVTAFDSAGYLIVPATNKGNNPLGIKKAISSIGPGGGTNMEPGIQLAYDELRKVKGAAVKHMVILTDGQTEGTGYEQLIQRIQKDQITVSTIAVGGDADKRMLSQLASIGRGKFYHALSPKVLPRIFQQEARKISRPLIYENSSGFSALQKQAHDALKSIDSVPPLTGYVRSTIKNHPLVEVALVAAEPRDNGNDSAKYNTLLASWTYGLGKTAVWTSDTGQRWANGWSNQWPNYDRFFSQMIRWSMRPSGDMGKYTVTTNTDNERTQVIVTALNQDEEFINFLRMNGSVVGPEMKPVPLELKQVSPGRYLADFAASASGNYMIMISPGANQAPLITGMTVSYSAEYADREPNPVLLEQIAALQPRNRILQEDAAAGQVIAGSSVKDWLQYDTFRRTLPQPVASQEIWHWVLFAAGCLFFVDVFQRRVSIDGSYFGGLVRERFEHLLGRRPILATATPLDRLQQLKKAVTLDRNSLSDPPLLSPTANPSVLAPPTTMPSVSATAAPPPTEPAAEEIDYTNRLLQAKKEALRKRKNS